jgi:hypothetical protein
MQTPKYPGELLNKMHNQPHLAHKAHKAHKAGLSHHHAMKAIHHAMKATHHAMKALGGANIKQFLSEEKAEGSHPSLKNFHAAHKAHKAHKASVHCAHCAKLGVKHHARHHAKLPHLKPKGEKGKAQVKKLGRNFKTGGFNKIAKSAGKKYGSSEVGKKIAGKVFQNMVKARGK